MSAVREAIEAVLVHWNDTGEIELNEGDVADLASSLVEAVERVPVNVTIRDLDMEPENVLTVADPALVTYLAGQLRVANQGRFPVHFAVDQGAIKVKAGNQSWSMGVPTSEYEG